ncbi:metal ABC transporter permease [Deinococcus budaensis]|uniref:Manganese/zinc/iron transport system permease protein n=1 Tax=Deinococcus budaensis TaxID=1665626 RepID=A0A7W8GIH1_9DEIO|nr:metal ABC transporter permease [Deinococcus budaensis]MBB5236130.1 manganese/zinc/iron transport system permease protein [Deinococcus budaensis]
MTPLPLNFDLVIVVTAVLVAWACGLLGLFLVLRREALLSDAISHAALPGIVAGYWVTGGSLATLPALVGAALSGLLTVGLTALLTRSGRVKADAALGLVFPALFAAGVIAVSLNYSQVHLDLDAVLYGEIAYTPFRTGWGGLPVAWLLLGGMLVLNALFVGGLFKELRLSTFDPGLARTLGFSPGLLGGALLTLVALTTVAAFDSVGAVLVVAFMIVPPATALLLTRSLRRALALTLAAGLGASVLGYAVALWLDASITGVIAGVLGVQFMLALVAQAWRARRVRGRAVLGG